VVPAPAVLRTSAPPSFFQLVSHALRWRLLQELAASDRTVKELTERVGEPQNLVSYHLRQLRVGGLVRARRSSADGRDVYYALDLGECREQLHAAAGALHPALRPSPVSGAPAIEVWTDPTRAPRSPVLFLCTGNSARSQMAEALLVHLSQGAVDARSAGSHPKPLHPNAVRVMQRRGIDISHHRSKHIEELKDRRFAAVVTLCDKVKEICPDLPAPRPPVHWSIADPALAGPTDRASLPAFERTAEELEVRISHLLPTLTSPPARRSRHGHR
jgi:protein-tyrosine-phosphatase/DNA-binding transcriptional ArsR family regulator